MDSKEKENDQPMPKLFGKIPLIAIIFPPIGLLMFIRYLLNRSKRTGRTDEEKRKEEDTWNS